MLRSLVLVPVLWLGAVPASAPPANAAPADAATPAPAEGPRTFTLDPSRTLFVLQVFKDGAAAAFAHDHTVRATELAGEVTVDPAAPDSASVHVTVQTASLVNDEEDVRKRYGLPPEVPEKDRKAVEASMKGKEQLDVARYPTITFKSTSVAPKDGKHVLTGQLTLHGKTRTLALPITFAVQGNTLTGEGQVRFKQSDFGIKPYSAFLGAVRNKDEVLLHVHLVGVAR